MAPTSTPTESPPSSGDTQPPSEVAKKLVELTKALQVDGAADGISSTQLTMLIDVLQALAKAQSRPDPDKELVDKLTAQLKEFNKAGATLPGDAYADALILAANQADELLTRKNAAASLLRLDAKMVAAVAAAPKTDENVRKSLTNLLALFTKSWPPDLLGKMQTHVQAITDAIGVDKVADTNLQTIKNDRDARTAVAGLYALLMPVAVAAQKRVHIVSAIYGDRRAIGKVLARGKAKAPGSLDRWCNATAAMRTQCENKASCTAPAGVSTSLCGYDPVPFVSPQYKTAVVFYRCLDSNVPENWSGATANPGLENVFVPADERTSFSVSLWNDKQTIYCTAP
ncbi:hypothetical protein X728_11455 [Mesorhizobium sp. L103C120A0]|nr:hypothetical protein X728_11455 [Mesorhizobium sp. L103C120A0]